MRIVNDLSNSLKKVAKGECIFHSLHPLVARVHDLRSLFLTLCRLDLEIIMGVIIIIANFTLFLFCPFNNLRKPKITVHRHIFLNCVCKAENIQKKTVFFFVEKELFSRCLNDLQYWQNISENSKKNFGIKMM